MAVNNNANIDAQRKAAQASNTRTCFSVSGSPNTAMITKNIPIAEFGKYSQFQCVIERISDAKVGPAVNEIATTVA